MKEYKVVYTETVEYNFYVEARNKAEALKKYQEEVARYGIPVEEGRLLDSNEKVYIDK